MKVNRTEDLYHRMLPTRKCSLIFHPQRWYTPRRRTMPGNIQRDVHYLLRGTHLLLEFVKWRAGVSTYFTWLYWLIFLDDSHGGPECQHLSLGCVCPDIAIVSGRGPGRDWDSPDLVRPVLVISRPGGELRQAPDHRPLPPLSVSPLNSVFNYIKLNELDSGPPNKLTLERKDLRPFVNRKFLNL